MKLSVLSIWRQRFWLMSLTIFSFSVFHKAPLKRVTIEIICGQQATFYYPGIIIFCEVISPKRTIDIRDIIVLSGLLSFESSLKIRKYYGIISLEL